MITVYSYKALPRLTSIPSRLSSQSHRALGTFQVPQQLYNRTAARLYQNRHITTSTSRLTDRPLSVVDGGMSPAALKKPNGSKPRAPPGPPSPSASVLLISPTNQILLLHRVRHSSSFPSAHVFPGGNLDDFHDGEIPGVDDPGRHVDGEAYRMGAIRETFEESGILLAKNAGFGRLIEVEDEEREKGRKAVHGKEIKFEEWLNKVGGRADVGK